MGRSPCCDKVGLKKGPWTPEEDQKLLAYIEQHGHGSWRALPAKAGLQRCGKSCRLRWINYLRPDIKRGKFSLQEEQTIIQLHALLGNRWSGIAAHLPKRTDNEIKNYWNTHLKKRLNKMGIDPVTHKPKTNALGSATGNPKDAATLSHMAQWESARLEAEARLVRESKLVRSSSSSSSSSSSAPQHTSNPVMTPPATRPQCLDVLKAWQGLVTGLFTFNNTTDNLQSPTSTLNFVENTNTLANGLINDNSMELHEMGAWFRQDSSYRAVENMNMEDYSDMMVWESGDHQQCSSMAAPAENLNETSYGNSSSSSSSLEENRNYWNNILNLVS
ncbi:hypothetical protein Godav_029127 [Gossypium davidsonii]|uniref:Uncharacterized protein n=2 Tax=Gossypium TaxID=3633 RepID=A0A7J8TDU2_GOSDV|nr:hypothetical protein [Gossypium davidsonii]MBA0667649.1 hypothetical protein [Gossypium klotzschianum]